MWIFIFKIKKSSNQLHKITHLKKEPLMNQYHQCQQITSQINREIGSSAILN